MAGVILYEGPSMLDGKPIVVIATGLEQRKASRNGKTGAMIQTFIMRSDIAPHKAVKTGDDISVCGNCKRKPLVAKELGVKPCYVTVWQSPRSVYQAYRRGIYAREWSSATFEGLGVRLGSYGDPAACPFHIWSDTLAGTAFHTGYTHQWERFPEMAEYVMASVDTIEEQLHASFLGFRTFRVAPHDRNPRDKLKSEANCGASKEMGKRTSCDKWHACSGLAGKARADIVINEHP